MSYTESWSKDALVPSLVALVEDAQHEAYLLGESWISTEHLLLALTNGPNSHAAIVLRALNISLEQVRRQIKRDPCSSRMPNGTLKMTPRAERIMQITRKLAQESGCSAADTQHLLVALLLEGEGLAARVLHAVGLEAEALKKAAAQLPCA